MDYTHLIQGRGGHEGTKPACVDGVCIVEWPGQCICWPCRYLLHNRLLMEAAWCGGAWPQVAVLARVLFDLGYIRLHIAAE